MNEQQEEDYKILQTIARIENGLKELRERRADFLTACKDKMNILAKAKEACYVSRRTLSDSSSFFPREPLTFSPDVQAVISNPTKGL
jgi:hypothetical protein